MRIGTLPPYQVGQHTSLKILTLMKAQGGCINQENVVAKQINSFEELQLQFKPHT